MQLEIGISTRRYFPASGTAGLERSRVSGKSRVPCPPPMMMERTLPILTGVIFVGAIPQSIFPACSVQDLSRAAASTQAALGAFAANPRTPLDHLRITLRGARICISLQSPFISRPGCIVYKYLPSDPEQLGLTRAQTKERPQKSIFLKAGFRRQIFWNHGISRVLQPRNAFCGGESGMATLSGIEPEPLP
jgi:hypothetical protein